ncbi:PilW family protein [Ideonella sp.]|jgi:type IV pilus assembly protein PilW|uniref:PilW family protein n=1 Tax=Ideonella sp. TaxID=1929293 RepID=UPI0037C0485A
MSPLPLTLRPRLTRTRGLSLIELMISMVIGMVVVAAVLAAYLGSGASSKHSQAMAQITEDATVALNIMRSHIAQSGYSRPVAFNGGKIVPVYTGPSLFGCNTGFADLSKSIDALTCGSSSQHAIAVAFEADESNSIMGGSPKVPLDCIGNGLAELGSATPGKYFLSYSRFYIASSGSGGNALYCRGSSAGSTGGQALVENIQSMQVLYGLAEAGRQEARRYLTAQQLTNAGASYTDVVSVRLCVVVASSSNVLDAVTPYQGCDPFAAQTTPAAGDRRMYRAFTSTVVLQNRVL